MNEDPRTNHDHIHVYMSGLKDLFILGRHGAFIGLVSLYCWTFIYKKKEPYESHFQGPMFRVLKERILFSLSAVDRFMPD